MKDRSLNKILITGITGSGGSYLADYIVQNHPDVEVHGIARWHSTTGSDNLKRSREKVRVHECDLTDVSSIFTILENLKPDAIFHLASYANVKAAFTTPLAVMQNNILGTANLLETIRILRIDPVVQICSTSEVYGQVDPKNVPITEECALNPINPYAVSKLAQDALGYTYFKSYGMKVIRTRMFAYLNPRRSDLFATSFAMQVARIEAGLQSELLHGNLESTRTLIDVRDAMEAYWVAITRGKIGEVYNIGGTTIISVGEFLAELKKLARKPIFSRTDPSLLRPSDVTLQIPDTSKFKAATNWEPKINFKDSIAFLLDECRKKIHHILVEQESKGHF